VKRRDSIVEALRHGEWVRTQWVARVAYNLPAVAGGFLPYYAAAHQELERLRRQGRVDRRFVTDGRGIRRSEWRLRGE
jgi:hypothetical protein